MLINVLTYNMSWAAQVNKLLGSEADFVEECQKVYKNGGIQCIKNTIRNIKTLVKIDLMGIQEVNSALEGEIMKAQPSLKQFRRGTIGLSTVSTLWNPEIFGDVVFEKTINLMKGDDRPCLFLICKKAEQMFVIINLHMPWSDNRKHAIKALEKCIDETTMLREAMFDKSIKIIVMGDFNDLKTTIHKNRPLVLTVKARSISLKYNKDQKHARKTLKSCCWHKKKHKLYKYFSDTGDYILVNKNVRQKSINIPQIFRKAGRDNRLFSDHKPVLSVLEIE